MNRHPANITAHHPTYPAVSGEDQASRDLQALLSGRMAEAQRGETNLHSITGIADAVLASTKPA